MTEPILRVTALSKTFDGLAAVSDVSLELRPCEVHAVIGPNGAGKTTLINMLSGDLAPTAGAIRFEGREIAGLSADRVARLGIGRSYQKANIFPDFTLLENCRLAAQARLPSSLRFFRPALDRADLALLRLGAQPQGRSGLSSASGRNRAGEDVPMGGGRFVPLHTDRSGGDGAGVRNLKNA